jgi:hypothetical protein
MAYFSPDQFGLGYFGCGPGCACKSCQRSASQLAETYVEEEEEEPPGPETSLPAPLERRVRRRRLLRPNKARAPMTMGSYFGEPPAADRRSSLLPGLRLRLPPFEVLTGFAPGRWRLDQAHLAQIQRLAEHVVRTWTTTSPVTGIRLVGYADPGEPETALHRAGAARAALIGAISRTNPGVLRGIELSSEDGGSLPGQNGIVRRVEILLWVGLGVPFTPPPSRPSAWALPRISVSPQVRIPTPAEAARMVRPIRPETPDERIRRILTTLPPSPRPRRSFNQMFWATVDRTLDSAMSRVGVPQSLRSPLRDGAHAAISRGAEEILNRVLDASGLGPDAREAIRSTVRAAIETSPD